MIGIYIFLVVIIILKLSKNQLWKILNNYYGRNKASKLIPESFIINNTDDIELFKKHYKKGNVYLLKKNIQRKEGILILNDYKQIMKEVDNVKKKYMIFIITK